MAYKNPLDLADAIQEEDFFKIPLHTVQQISNNDPDFLRWAEDKYGIKFNKINDHEGYQVSGERLPEFLKAYGLGGK